MKKLNTKSLIVLALAICLIATGLPTMSVQAASKSTPYFKDVKAKSTYSTEVEYLAKNGGYKGIAKKGAKLSPSKVITREQVAKILTNLYGDRIYLEVKKPKDSATQKFVTNMLTDVSEQLGYRIKWDGGAPKAKVSRALASRFIYQTIKLGGDYLKP